MKVMIAGRDGQLGRQLTGSVPDGVQVRSTGSKELDITDAAAVREAVGDFRPEVVVNAAAYTAVDRAEEEREKAHAVNRDGVANLAEAVAAIGARLVHISTDFVFDGSKSSPYNADDRPNPISVYGASKLAGEEKVLGILGSNVTVFRTSWVYSVFGGNFVLTMLRLMRERDELGVVCDQVGTPTWAGSLAEVVWAAVRRQNGGIYNWSDAGVAGWYDFAVAIYEEARDCGLLNREVLIKPITTDAYPTAAKRPPYSVLDKSATLETFHCPIRHWRENLRTMLHKLKDMRNE